MAKQNINIEELPFAELYTSEPYYGCPNCEGNCYGAINPTEPGEMIYMCHGTSVGMVQYPGCGKLFRLPKEAHTNHDEDEMEGEDEEGETRS